MESVQNPTEVKKPKEEKTVQVPSSSQSLAPAWIIFFVVFIVLLVGAIMLGQRAESQYGDAVLAKLPQNMVAKWTNSSVSPVPTAIPFAKPTVTVEPTIITTPAITAKLINTVTPETTSPADANTSGEFIFSFSNTRKVTNSDLMGLTPWELKVARNEIYARHGRPFVHKDLACYFIKQPWYAIDTAYSDKSLSSLEVANAVFILNYEKSIDSPLVNTDSGCKN